MRLGVTSPLSCLLYPAMPARYLKSHIEATLWRPCLVQHQKNKGRDFDVVVVHNRIVCVSLCVLSLLTLWRQKLIKTITLWVFEFFMSKNCKFPSRKLLNITIDAWVELNCCYIFQEMNVSLCYVLTNYVNNNSLCVCVCAYSHFSVTMMTKCPQTKDGQTDTGAGSDALILLLFPNAKWLFKRPFI